MTKGNPPLHRFALAKNYSPLTQKNFLIPPWRSHHQGSQSLNSIDDCRIPQNCATRVNLPQRLSSLSRNCNLLRRMNEYIPRVQIPHLLSELTNYRHRRPSLHMIATRGCRRSHWFATARNLPVPRRMNPLILQVQIPRPRSELAICKFLDFPRHMCETRDCLLFHLCEPANNHILPHRMNRSVRRAHILHPRSGLENSTIPHYHRHRCAPRGNRAGRAPLIPAPASTQGRVWISYSL